MPVSCISSLPDELLHDIFTRTLISTRLQSSQWSARFSLALSLVCKRWHPIALPLVYHHCVMTPSNVHSLLARLGERPDLGQYVKKAVCISKGFGSGVGSSQLSSFLDHCPNIDDIFIARFWHQWLTNGLALSPTFASLKNVVLHFEYSPLPNPDASQWLGQFRSWPSLERLEIRYLSFMSDDGGGYFKALRMGGGFGGGNGGGYLGVARDSMDVDSDDAMEIQISNHAKLSPILPDPNSHLRELVIIGNIIPSSALIAGLSSLRAPLQILELNGIGLLGPEGCVAALELVGRGLREFRLLDDGRIGAVGRVDKILLPHLRRLTPSLETLQVQNVRFGEEAFDMLPRSLRLLVVRRERSTLPHQVIAGLEKSLKELNRLKTVVWTSELGDTWTYADIRELVEWGRINGVMLAAYRLVKDTRY